MDCVDQLDYRQRDTQGPYQRQPWLARQTLASSAHREPLRSFPLRDQETTRPAHAQMILDMFPLRGQDDKSRHRTPGSRVISTDAK